MPPPSVEELLPWLCRYVGDWVIIHADSAWAYPSLLEKIFTYRRRVYSNGHVSAAATYTQSPKSVACVFDRGHAGGRGSAARPQLPCHSERANCDSFGHAREPHVGIDCLAVPVGRPAPGAR